MLCIDTNLIIAALNGRNPAIASRLEREIGGGVVAVPVIVIFELKYGIANSGRREENVRRLDRFLQSPISIFEFSNEDAEEAAEIRADLKRRGTPIGPYDVLIAAQARCRGATLVSANTREFSRVPRLALDDWTL